MLVLTPENGPGDHAADSPRKRLVHLLQLHRHTLSPNTQYQSLTYISKAIYVCMSEQLVMNTAGNAVYSTVFLPDVRAETDKANATT